jgi:hypothetical protein
MIFGELKEKEICNKIFLIFFSQKWQKLATKKITDPNSRILMTNCVLVKKIPSK